MRLSPVIHDCPACGPGVHISNRPSAGVPLAHSPTRARPPPATFPISPVTASLVRLTYARADESGHENGRARVVCRILAPCRSRSRPGLPLGR